MLSDKDLKEAPILVMANKQDKDGAMNLDDIYKELGLAEVINTGVKKDICFQGCSAMNGNGVWEGIK